MEDFTKTVTVKGSSGEHTLIIKAESGVLKIHCDCQAGIYKKLCKHVIECINTDKDLQSYLTNTKLGNALEKYYDAKNEIDRLQGEVRRLKRNIEKELF